MAQVIFVACIVWVLGIPQVKPIDEFSPNFRDILATKNGQNAPGLHTKLV